MPNTRSSYLSPTQGLALEDAEKGVVRLRSLGFEAKAARDLVAGIAKNKVLSGAVGEIMLPMLSPE